MSTKIFKNFLYNSAGFPVGPRLREKGRSLGDAWRSNTPSPAEGGRSHEELICASTFHGPARQAQTRRSRRAGPKPEARKSKFETRSKPLPHSCFFASLLNSICGIDPYKNQYTGSGEGSECPLGRCKRLKGRCLIIWVGYSALVTELLSSGVLGDRVMVSR